jgi:hypothetical protein
MTHSTYTPTYIHTFAYTQHLSRATSEAIDTSYIHTCISHTHTQHLHGTTREALHVLRTYIHRFTHIHSIYMEQPVKPSARPRIMWTQALVTISTYIHTQNIHKHSIYMEQPVKPSKRPRMTWTQALVTISTYIHTQTYKNTAFTWSNP